jgi:hypothetical protein
MEMIILWRHHGEGKWEAYNLGCFMGDSLRFYLILYNFLRLILLLPAAAASPQTSGQKPTVRQ